MHYPYRLKLYIFKALIMSVTDSEERLLFHVMNVFIQCAYTCILCTCMCVIESDANGGGTGYAWSCTCVCMLHGMSLYILLFPIQQSQLLTMLTVGVPRP